MDDVTDDAKGEFRRIELLTGPARRHEFCQHGIMAQMVVKRYLEFTRSRIFYATPAGIDRAGLRLTQSGKRAGTDWNLAFPDPGSEGKQQKYAER